MLYAGDSRSRILVSNNNSLQATIDHLDKDSRARHILILVSPQLGSLYEFDVSSEYTTLMILRCGHGKIHSKEPHGRVRITPGSTFAGIRISDWDEEERTRELYIGEGVGIPSSFNKLNSKTSSVNSLSPSEKERLYQTFQDMRNTDMSGKWWREWRGKVAAIVGLTVGAGKAMIGMHATATGVFIDMKYGLFALKAGGIQTSAVVTAAGSACLLGVGVAAAVYFIPWDDLFSWLGNLISSFFSWLWKVWQEFMEWVSDKIECLRSHVASRMEAARAMKHK
jgi:hypothetical protein